MGGSIGIKRVPSSARQVQEAAKLALGFEHGAQRRETLGAERFVLAGALSQILCRDSCLPRSAAC